MAGIATGLAAKADERGLGRQLGGATPTGSARTVRRAVAKGGYAGQGRGASTTPGRLGRASEGLWGLYQRRL